MGRTAANGLSHSGKIARARKALAAGSWSFRLAATPADALPLTWHLTPLPANTPCHTVAKPALGVSSLPPFPCPFPKPLANGQDADLSDWPSLPISLDFYIRGEYSVSTGP